jgi:cysteine desulfurase/selenocysteine lyase
MRADDFSVERLRGAEFDWMDRGDVVYLNAASTGPQPARSVAAETAFTARRATPHRISFEDQFDTLARCRSAIARLVGGDEEEIALATNTSAGINLAAWGLRLGSGDVVVVSDGEFPANMYPWMAAARARGFELAVVPQRDRVLDEDALLTALDRPRVRVLAVSWVGFATGYTADLGRLGAACRRRGVTFVVDAIQGLGPLTLDVRRTAVDILACGAQKWLLGPWGTGFTYVRRAVLPELTPQPVSWMAVRGSDDFSRLLDYELTWRDSARRFEPVTLAYQDFAGLAASLELLHELGPATVAGRIGRGARRLLEGARDRGIPAATPLDRCAGIAALRPANAAAVSARLSAAGVIHSLREDTVRLAPHAYTTDAELETALARLAD